MGKYRSECLILVSQEIVGQRGRGLAGDLNVGRDLFYTVGQWGYGKEVGPQENNVWGDGKPNGLV